MKTLLRRLALVTAIVLGGVGLFAAPVAAHPLSGYWGNADTICDGCKVSRGNIVQAWQSVLVASVGGLGDCSTWADGVFGSHTAAATHTWQSNHHIRSDGVVGPQTWSTLYNLLIFSDTQAGYDFYYFAGAYGRVWFRHSAATGNWDFAGGIAPFADTNHPGITPDSCIGFRS